MQGYPYEDKEEEGKKKKKTYLWKKKERVALSLSHECHLGNILLLTCMPPTVSADEKLRQKTRSSCR